MRDFGYERADDLIREAHRRGSNIESSVARVGESTPTEIERRILAAHGVCAGCTGLGRTTSCPKDNPNCRFSPARTFAEIIGSLEAYRQYVKQSLEGR